MASVDFDSIISLRFRLPKFNMPAARTLRGEGTKKANKSNFNTGLLFFRFPVAVRLSISTKLCTQIEHVSTISGTHNYFWIRSLVFCARGQKHFSRFLVPKFFFVINPLFMNRILPKLRYRCRPSSSIKVENFIICDQGIRRHGRK